jgi:hypothetical protein
LAPWAEVEERACAMRCLVCGAEMHVEQVAPDDTMPVSGYEHRTLKCPQCGDTERRLVFVGDRTSAESTSVETTNPVVETTIPVVETTIPVVETTIPVVETTIPVVETTIPVVETTIPVVETRISVADRGQDQPGVAPDAGSVAKWAQAVEKVRTRHTALAQAVAAENKPAKTAATRSNEAMDDFDRMWESPVPPRQQPPPRSEPSPPQRRDDPLRGTTPPPATTPRTPFRRPDTPFAPVRSDAAAAPARLKPAPESKSSQTKTLPTKTLQSNTPQGNTSQGNTSQGAWARAVAMLRERLDRATKLDRNDTILRIDDDALKVKPRQGQSRPPKPDCPD